MPSALPILAAGAVVVPNLDAQNVYIPLEDFTIGCDYTALPSTCDARILPSQINAIISELIALAECFNPTGEWDCDALNNLCANFTVLNTQNQSVLDNHEARIAVLEGGGVTGLPIAYASGVSGTQSFAQGTSTTIKDWNPIAVPNGGLTYNSSTGLITIAMDGVWLITCFINMAQDTELERTTIIINGNTVASQENRGTSDDNRLVSVSAVVPLVVGDVIDLRAFAASSGGTFTLANGRMSVSRIGGL